MRALPMQTRNRAKVYAGHGSHGKPADGFGTCGFCMGTAQDVAAGKRDTGHDKKGGESMAATGRYIYCPMTAARIGRRMTIADRFRRWQRIRRDRKQEPDLFMISGYARPVYPVK